MTYRDRPDSSRRDTPDSGENDRDMRRDRSYRDDRMSRGNQPAQRPTLPARQRGFRDQGSPLNSAQSQRSGRDTGGATKSSSDDRGGRSYRGSRVQPEQSSERLVWDDELGWLDPDITDHGHVPIEEFAPSTGGRPSRTTTRPRRSRASSRQPVTVPRVTIPKVTVPRFVADADLVGDRVALVMFGVSIFSTAVMAAVMSNRVGALPAVVSVHIDAAGFPDRWADREILWRIPLIGLMITVINLVIAWLVTPSDRFAGRFALGSALVVQVLAWVALGDFIL